MFSDGAFWQKLFYPLIFDFLINLNTAQGCMWSHLRDNNSAMFAWAGRSATSKQMLQQMTSVEWKKNLCSNNKNLSSDGEEGQLNVSIPVLRITIKGHCVAMQAGSEINIHQRPNVGTFFPFDKLIAEGYPPVGRCLHQTYTNTRDLRTGSDVIQICMHA